MLRGDLPRKSVGRRVAETSATKKPPPPRVLGNRPANPTRRSYPAPAPAPFSPLSLSLLLSRLPQNKKEHAPVSKRDRRCSAPLCSALGVRGEGVVGGQDRIFVEQRERKGETRDPR